MSPNDRFAEVSAPVHEGPGLEKIHSDRVDTPPAVPVFCFPQA